MKLDQIVTMASAGVRLELLAMERSLRATGCDLPLRVIPYHDDTFALPKNAEWIRNDELFSLLGEVDAVPHTRKFQAFLEHGCAFFDTDIIHLKNPCDWIAPVAEETFVVADTEWAKAMWTFTPETRAIYQHKSTLWLLDQFNTGFFAFQKEPFTFDQMRPVLLNRDYRNLLHGKGPTPGEQAAANLLIHLSGMEVCNLCLPPYKMESTMACDYLGDFEQFLKKPNGTAFVHYAGAGRDLDAPITRLIFDYLTKEEANELRMKYDRLREQTQRNARWPLWVRMARRIIPHLDRRFCIQWQQDQKK